LPTARARREQTKQDARRLLDDALGMLPRARSGTEQPPSLSPGELELLYVPATSGWIGFARTAEDLAVERLGSVDPRASPEDLARTMLGPFDAAIARARTIRFLPYAGARAVDLHALPWQGRPLLEHAVVEYALGFDAASNPEPDARRALVIADAAGDLPEARAEADAVVSVLGRSQWTVDDVRGPAADGEAVRRTLASANLLHYAGHATFGGADGADSALSLARGSRLTPADVLALPRVPEVVALFGCDTAHESATGTIDALGLTSAFLVAGAQVVVATSREVDDALARHVATAFYTRLAGAPHLEPGGALREAVLEVREQSPASDWAAFRVLVP
jgi:CHAT domain-containing protein